VRRGFFVGLAALVACFGGDVAPDRRTLIDSRDNYDPRSLDPALSTDVPTGRAVGYIFDGLTRFTPTAQVEPGLAERWDLSSDGRTYTFHLRRSVHFHDGSSFGARDVVASWERALEPSTRSSASEFLYPIKGARDFHTQKAKTVAGLSVRDDSTIVVTLEEPLAAFLKLLAMPVASIVPQRIAPNFGERPIGTGPWRLIDWHHDDYLLFARNDQYFLGPPKAESLEARIIAEPSTSVAEFESGNVDVLQIPAGQIREWEDDESRRPMLSSTPALELVYVGINTTRGPLVDPRVRQAINYAVDINTIIERLVAGRGTRAAGVIPPALAGYDSARRPYPFNPAKAKQLLAAAGHPNGIDVELWVSMTPIYVRIAETIQAYLNAVGIRTKVVQRESAASRAAARKGETDMILKDWYADYPDAENFLYPLLYSGNKGSGGNVSFYANTRFDSTVLAARRELNATKRAALLRSADSIGFVDAPMMFLYFYNELYAVQPWVKGFRPPVIFNGQRWLDVSLSAERGGQSTPADSAPHVAPNAPRSTRNAPPSTP
jgi:peptide/nickel transport system substrate-binding protein/oligopeptide transport system substrate-binding protein